MKLLAASILFFLIFTVVPVKAQSVELITGGQAPEKTFNEIVNPVINFFGKLFNFFQLVLTRLLDVEWIKHNLLSVFGTINDWFYKIFGMDIGEVLAAIGNIFVIIFNWLIAFFTKLWPF